MRARYLILLFILMNCSGAKYMSQNTGLIDGKFKELSNKPNWVSTQSKKNQIEPIVFGKPITKMIELLTEMGGKLQLKEENYLYFIFTSRIFRFKDDVEISIDKGNQMVHFKSSSRVGYSDFGVNRKRYNHFKKLYQNK